MGRAGHSFGGHVALEYALRYPDSLSHLVLLDSGGDSRWSQQNAADLVAERGYSPEKVELVRRWFNGEFAPREFFPISMRIWGAYFHRPGLWAILREVIDGGWRAKMRPEAQIFAFRHLVKGWTVVDRLGEVTVPTLVMAGRDDFVFPPDCQLELAAGIPGARLRIVERAGHNPYSEQPAEVMRAVSDLHLRRRAGGLTGVLAAGRRLTTILPDGYPQTSWCGATSTACARVNATLERQKGRNLLANPKASLLVVDPDDTARFIQIRGDAELVTDGALEHLDALTRSHTRHPRYCG